MKIYVNLIPHETIGWYMLTYILKYLTDIINFRLLNSHYKPRLTNKQVRVTL